MVRPRTLSKRPILFLITAAWSSLLIVSSLPDPALGDDLGTPADYQPPVEAPIVDHFRPPAHIGGSGNRGLEYGTTPGSPVRAAKRGQVTFAGPVAGSLYVTVVHTDGLRTSYSHLLEVVVARGQFVSGGQILGSSGAAFHFGVRDGSTYLDPAQLFDSGPRRARLVALLPGPDQDRRPRAGASGPLGWLRAAEVEPRGANGWLAPMRRLADLAVHFGSSSG